MNQIELEKLNKEWEEFCKKTYAEWKHVNIIPIFIYNTKFEFDAAIRRGKKWCEHIRKLGDEWWKSRNFVLEWPEDWQNSNEPLRIRKTET